MQQNDSLAYVAAVPDQLGRPVPAMPVDNRRQQQMLWPTGRRLCAPNTRGSSDHGCTPCMYREVKGSWGEGGLLETTVTKNLWQA